MAYFGRLMHTRGDTKEVFGAHIGWTNVVLPRYDCSVDVVQLGISPWALGSSKVVVVVRLMAGVVLNHRQQLDLPLPFYARFLLCYLTVSYRARCKNRLASSCLLLK